MIEITVDTDYADALVVTADDDMASIGFKRFRKVGEFKYDWLISHMNPEDVQALIKSLQFAHALMETE